MGSFLLKPIADVIRGAPLPLLDNKNEPCWKASGHLAADWLVDMGNNILGCHKSLTHK